MLTDSAYAIVTEDVDFINSAESGSTINVAISLTGSGGVELTRATIAGNIGTRIVNSSGLGALMLKSCVVAGNFVTTLLAGNMSTRSVGSTIAGNYLNGAASTLSDLLNVNSITDKTYSTVGFKTPPPNSLAEADWNKDLWKTWDLSLTDESSYNSGAEALDEFDTRVVGDDWRYDVEGCPRKPNGAFGAYEDRTGVRLVTTVADSGAGSLRQAVADAVDGDSVLFSYATFPKGETTPIPLNTYILVNKSISIYGGEIDGDGGYTSDATITRYVVREVEGVETEVVVDDDNPALEGEVVLMHVTTRVALDGQATQNPNAEGDWDGWSGTRVLVCSAGGIAVGLYGIEFKNGLSAYTESGPLIYFTPSDVSSISIADCKLSGGVNAAGIAGGAVFRTKSIVNATRVEITKCRAKGSCGALYLVGSTISTLTDLCIKDCTSTNGGAIYTANTSANTLNACTINDCRSTNNGGGVFTRDTSQNTLNDCTISDCNASACGGGVFSANTSQNTLNACT